MLAFEMMVEKAQNAVAQLLTDRIPASVPFCANTQLHGGTMEAPPPLQLRFQAQMDARGGAPHEREAHETHRRRSNEQVFGGVCGRPHEALSDPRRIRWKCTTGSDGVGHQSGDEPHEREMNAKCGQTRDRASTHANRRRSKHEKRLLALAKYMAGYDTFGARCTWTRSNNDEVAQRIRETKAAFCSMGPFLDSGCAQGPWTQSRIDSLVVEVLAGAQQRTVGACGGGHTIFEETGSIETMENCTVRKGQMASSVSAAPRGTQTGDHNDMGTKLVRGGCIAFASWPALGDSLQHDSKRIWRGTDTSQGVRRSSNFGTSAAETGRCCSLLLHLFHPQTMTRGLTTQPRETERRRRKVTIHLRCHQMKNNCTLHNWCHGSRKTWQRT